MAELHQNERFVINELFNRGIFKSTPTQLTTQVTREAIQALKRPLVQQRINAYLKDLVGYGPRNYQENLVFLLGKPQLDVETVHVLLATLKAVINIPEIPGSDGLVVPTQTIVRQVHSEVVTLDEREIYRRITALFVERFGLFIPDAPINQNNDLPQEVTEYWDVDADFNSVAQCIVNELQLQTQRADPTPIQEVNRVLLTQQFIGRYLEHHRPNPLWAVLQAHKETIAAQWAQLDRFELECGDQYALLLDNQRQPVTARAFVVAIAVAKQLGAGVPVDELNDKIRKVMPAVLGKATVTPTEVKKALLVNDLVREKNGYYSKTALVTRFDVATADEEDVVHANE